MFFKVSRKRQRSRGGKLTWQMQECDVGEKAGNRSVWGTRCYSSNLVVEIDEKLERRPGLMECV